MRKLIRIAMFTVSIVCATVPAQAGVDRFTSVSPEGVDISSIVIDPLKVTTIYASSTYAGVLKSSDGGENWTLVFDLETLRKDRASQRFLSKLVIDPIRSSTVYAVIHRYRPGARAVSEIAKTADGGETWSILQAWQDREPVIDLVIDPSSPDTLYALDHNGLWQSSDGGLSWNSRSAGLAAVFAREFKRLVIDPSLPSRLYVSSRRGLYVSNDRGGVWELLTAGADFDQVAVDPGDSTTLYASSNGFLFSSRDSGKTWTSFAPGHVLQIVVDSRSSATYAVFARGNGALGMTVSTDRGVTWTTLPGGPVPALLAIEPGSSDVFYGAGRGDLQKTENRGKSWRPLRGVAMPSISDVAVDAAGSGTIFAALQKGVLKSGDGGQSWRNVNPDLPGAQLSIDPRNPSTLFAHNYQTASRSSDGGETWTAINPGRNVQGFAIDPSDSANVYAVLYDGLSRSRDGGSTWRSVASAAQLPMAYYGFEGGAIAVDPVTPANVYAAGSGGIVKSMDAGTTWRTVFTSDDWYGEYFRKLLIDPAAPSTIYALAYNKVYRSYNEGSTWNVVYLQSQAGNYLTDLELDPLQPSRLYLATSAGLLKSENGGNLWTDFNEGLPTLGVTAVMADPNGNVYAATPRGLFVNSPRLQSASFPALSLRTLLGNYMSATDCGGSFVNANALAAGSCEQFTIYDLNGGVLSDGDRIHLRAANGQFVAAEDGGRLDRSEVPVNANRRLPASWETFVIRRQGGGTTIASGDSIALQSINGAYLAAEGGGARNCDCDSRLNANRFDAREWETFVIEIR